MWFRSNRKTCLKCGGRMKDFLDGVGWECGACGFKVLATSDGRLCWEDKSAQHMDRWPAVPHGLLWVASWEEDKELD